MEPHAVQGRIFRMPDGTMEPRIPEDSDVICVPLDCGDPRRSGWIVAFADLQAGGQMTCRELDWQNGLAVLRSTNPPKATHELRIGELGSAWRVVQVVFRFPEEG